MLTLPVLDLTHGGATVTGACGSIDIPDSGRKHGTTVVFTPEHRRAVERALAGYLSRYEAAWCAGSMRDYSIFPGRRLRRRRHDAGPRQPCAIRPSVKPLDRTGARAAFHELERIAGVTPVRGRGWYGLRRVASDLAEALTHDDRVKNALGGWRDSTTRTRIYQDHESVIVRIEAAVIRQRMRLGRSGTRWPVGASAQPVRVGRCNSRELRTGVTRGTARRDVRRFDVSADAPGARYVASDAHSVQE
jgi:hypothetical protein